MVYAEDGAEEIEEVMVIGTRRRLVRLPTHLRLWTSFLVEFTRNAASDVQELLRTSVPAYNVNAQPISDAATVIAREPTRSFA